jgi:LDH2 family malate/lactate/ureidoglycolate dehydrogenase
METPVAGRVDAGAGLGHPAAVMGMELAIRKAREMGVGVATVFNSHHFGAAGYYAGLASRAGMVGMVTSCTRSIAMVPTRAAVPVLGTNPIAFAAPAKRNAPFLLDMATTSVANNKLKVYDLNGKTLPAGWVLDGRGEPVREPKKAMEIVRSGGKSGGGQTPLGGTAEMSSHKGYGLAMMGHILGGTLSGGVFSHQKSNAENVRSGSPRPFLPRHRPEGVPSRRRVRGRSRRRDRRAACDAAHRSGAAGAGARRSRARLARRSSQTRHSDP